MSRSDRTCSTLLIALVLGSALTTRTAGAECVMTFLGTQHTTFYRPCIGLYVNTWYSAVKDDIVAGAQAWSDHVSFPTWDSEVPGDGSAVGINIDHTQAVAAEGSVGNLLGQATPFTDATGTPVGGRIDLHMEIVTGAKLEALTAHEVGHILIGAGHFYECQDCRDLEADDWPTMLAGECSLWWSSDDWSDIPSFFSSVSETDDGYVPSFLHRKGTRGVVGLLDRAAATGLIPCALPSATVSRFEREGDRIYWAVEEDTAVQAFIVRARSNADAPWSDIGFVNARGVGEYESWAAVSAFTEIRLYVVDVNGVDRPVARLSIDTAPRFSSAQITHGDELHSTRGRLDGLLERARSSGNESLGRTIARSVVAFVPGPFVRDYEHYVISFWDEWGAATHTIEYLDTYPQDRDARREAIRSAIATYASQGITHFHLVGAASDAGLEGASQWARAENDLIPTFYTVDDRPRQVRLVASGRPYRTSDLPYADLDGDELPDVVVARWPVASQREHLNAISKLLRHNLGLSVDADIQSLVAIQDEFLFSSEGRVPSEAFAALLHTIPADLSTALSPHFDSTIMFSSESAQFSTTIRHLLDVEGPQLVILHGGESSMYNPAYALDRSYKQFWETSSPQTTTAVLAHSCTSTPVGIGQYNPQNVKMREFMVGHETGGAIAWSGPSGSSYEMANQVVTQYVAARMTPGGPTVPPISEMWLAGMRDAIQALDPTTDFGKVALSYSFVGDPLSTLSPTPSSMGSAGQLVLVNALPWPGDGMSNGEEAEIIVLGANCPEPVKELRFRVDLPPEVDVVSRTLGSAWQDLDPRADFWHLRSDTGLDLVGQDQILVRYRIVARGDASNRALRLRPVDPEAIYVDRPQWVGVSGSKYQFTGSDGYDMYTLRLDPTVAAYGDEEDLTSPRLVHAQVIPMPGDSDDPQQDYLGAVRLVFSEPMNPSILELNHPSAPFNGQFIGDYVIGGPETHGGFMGDFFTTLNAGSGPHGMWVESLYYHTLNDEVLVQAKPGLSPELFSDLSWNQIPYYEPVVITPRSSVRSLRINELMIRPSVGSPEAASRREWIEIHNPSAHPVDISGWVLRSSSTARRDEWILPETWPIIVSADGYLLIAEGREAMESNGLHADVFVDGLDLHDAQGSVELLARATLREFQGTEELPISAPEPISSVSWDASSGWPLADGVSMQRRRVGDGSVASGWHSEAPAMPDGDFGTPGVKNRKREADDGEDPIRVDVPSPNPFNPIVSMSMDLTSTHWIEVTIYDVRGQRVRRVISETLAAGRHTIVWNGTDENGRGIASGTYFARIVSDQGELATHKLLLAK